jgi:hypothetical protein
LPGNCDGQPPIISDTIPANGSVITTSWPIISATLSDPEPGSGVQPLSTTLIIDSEVVTPQVNTAGGFAYTPAVRLTDGVHTVTAQVYDQAGNQAQSGPWSFTVVDDSAPSLGVTKYYMPGSQRAVRPASAARRDRHAPGRCGIPWPAWRQPGQASSMPIIWGRLL